VKTVLNPQNTRFEVLLSICKTHFGAPSISGSHHIFKTPWKGDPRLNLQKDGTMAKPYQVKQVVAAPPRLEKEHAE
jgi:hypothetical protein